MLTSDRDIKMACLGYLDNFFASYDGRVQQKDAVRVLCSLIAAGEPLPGKPAGWAAGIIYALATDARIPCGVPGVLNADFERFFDVSMGTVRKRAAQIARRGIL